MPLRRFGAVCVTEKMVYLQLKFSRKVQREWRRLFKSVYFKAVQAQTVLSFEKAFTQRLAQTVPQSAPQKPPKSETPVKSLKALMFEGKSQLSLI